MVFIGMGFECVGAVLACMYVGGWLDQKYDWGGYGSAIGAMVGLVAWVIHLLQVASAFAKEEEKEENSASKDQQ